MKEPTLVLTRIFDAAREDVFKAWTEREQLMAWFGPKHFTIPIAEIEAHVGGKLYLVMQGPDGMQYPMEGIFTEVTEPSKLVFTGTPLDTEGKPLFEDLNTVIFEEVDGKTKVTLTVEMLSTSAAPEIAKMLEGMEEGWSMSWDKLAELLR
jgi:uncharacterized protein YndB with AHSA1/START domain